MGRQIRRTLGRFRTCWLGKTEGNAGPRSLPITAEQLAVWKTSANPLRETWANSVKKTGGNPETIAKEFADALDRHQAGY